MRAHDLTFYCEPHVVGLYFDDTWDKQRSPDPKDATLPRTPTWSWEHPWERWLPDEKIVIDGDSEDEADNLSRRFRIEGPWSVAIVLSLLPLSLWMTLRFGRKTKDSANRVAVIQSGWRTMTRNARSHLIRIGVWSSMVACVAVIALWIRRDPHGDEVRLFSDSHVATIRDGGWVLMKSDDWGAKIWIGKFRRTSGEPPPADDTGSDYDVAEPRWSDPNYQQRLAVFHSATRTEALSTRCFAAIIPHWCLFIATAFAPASAAFPSLKRLLQSRWRARHGRCPRCGYDIRATLGKCSECGYGYAAAS